MDLKETEDVPDAVDRIAAGRNSSAGSIEDCIRTHIDENYNQRMNVSNFCCGIRDTNDGGGDDDDWGCLPL